MNPDLNRLQPYPFEKLTLLKASVKPPAALPHIALSIGEPQHPTPKFLCDELTNKLATLSSYPTTKGTLALRQSICAWVIRRFGIAPSLLDPERHVLPVNGTREALFAFAQSVIDRSRRPAPVVIMPNPFYQIYEGAAYLSGAEPYFLNTTATNGYIPDFDSVPSAIWERCQLIYICSPNNPTGTVLSMTTLQRLIALSAQYGFVIAADECYTEIYPDEAARPHGIINAALQAGLPNFDRIVAFHSLSKRSNVPGLRSGFVLGDATLIEKFLLYRTYHGCAMPLPIQSASIMAWNDETHVRANRDLYRQKFAAVLKILQPVLDVQAPDAAFYLWPKTPIVDTEFARGLFAKQHVTVLPGSYLSRSAHGLDPGAHHVRMALVAPVEQCIEAAERIRDFIQHG